MRALDERRSDRTDERRGDRYQQYMKAARGSRDDHKEPAPEDRKRRDDQEEPDEQRSFRPKVTMNLKKRETCGIQEAAASPERRPRKRPETEWQLTEAGSIKTEVKSVPQRGRSNSPPRDRMDRYADGRGRRYEKGSRSRSRSCGRQRQQRSPSPRRHDERPNAIRADLGPRSSNPSGESHPERVRRIGAALVPEQMVGPSGRRGHENVPTTSVMPIFSNQREAKRPSDTLATVPEQVPDWLQDIVSPQNGPTDFERPKGPYKEVHIPFALMNRLIGKGGEVIDMIHQTSGCKISVHQETAAVTGYCVCILTGTESAMTSAEYLMRQQVGGGESGLQIKELHIPPERVKAVIGPRGAILKEIRARSGGLRVEIRPPDLAIVGPGSKEQINVAEALIMCRIEGRPLAVMPACLMVAPQPATDDAMFWLLHGAPQAPKNITPKEVKHAELFEDAD